MCSHTGVYPHNCDFDGCSKGFTSKRDLKKHYVTHTGERSFVCDFIGCSFSTGQAYYLRTHKNSHTGEKKIKCPFEGCKFKTGYPSSLYNHKKTHSDDRPYACTYPGCEHTSKKHITKRHMRTHTGEKPFKCTFEGCKYDATTKKSFDDHVRTHTGERPFKCPYEGCEHDATQSGNLSTHIRRIHKGEKNFACPFPGCKHTTFDKKGMDSHQVTHTGEKPHKCSECGRGLTTQGSLAIHMRTHTGERPYKCDEDGCDEAFITKGALNVHKKRWHTLEGRQKRERKENIFEKWLKENLPEGWRYERQVRVDFCGDEGVCRKYAAVDFVIYSDLGYLAAIELDEDQHKNHNGDASCDPKRMHDIRTSSLRTPDGQQPLVFFRINPDKFWVGGTYEDPGISNRIVGGRRIGKVSRDRGGIPPEERYAELLEQIKEVGPIIGERKMMLAVVYMFYDVDDKGRLQLYNDPAYPTERFRPLVVRTVYGLPEMGV
jgi:hypothetical protein